MLLFGSFDFFGANMPLVMMSLGEIIVQNPLNTVLTFSRQVRPDNPKSALPLIHDLLNDIKTQELIRKLKLGEITDEFFTWEMRVALEEKTGVLLTLDEFNKAWHAMNPTFEEFSPLLTDLLKNVSLIQDLHLVSYTNPKDMQHLQDELTKGAVPYTLGDKGELQSIGGIPVYLSYIEKKHKADLIDGIIDGYKDSTSIKTSLSRFHLFQEPKKEEDSSLIIKYICSNNAEDNQEQLCLFEKLIGQGVQIVSWQKETQSLASLLAPEEESEKVMLDF